MFQYEVWSPSAPDKLYIVKDFIDGDFYTKKRSTKRGNLTACVSFLVGCIGGVQCVFALAVTIFHIETFVTFDFDPFLISRVGRKTLRN